MNIPRISGVVNILPERPGGGERAALPAPGETVLLTLGEPQGDEILATTPGGLALRLTGLGGLNRDLRPGDTLSMRVTANDPVLELQFYDARPAAEAGRAIPAPLSDLPAMRLDLAGLRTIAWTAPSAAALAVAWQVQAAERLMFPVYVWSGAKRGGLQMVLSLVDWHEATPRSAPRRRRAARHPDRAGPSPARVHHDRGEVAAGRHSTDAGRGGGCRASSACDAAGRGGGPVAGEPTVGAGTIDAG